MSSQVDWEAIEREYRAGQLSVSEIGRRFSVSEGAIRKRAKKYDWVRDLTAQVREAVRAKLAEAELADSTNEGTRAERARTSSEIVDKASERGLALVTSHRRDLEQLHGLKRILAGRLSTVLQGGEADGPCLGERESPGDLLEKLSRITTRLIPLERQAHNLDEGSGGSSEGYTFTFKLDRPSKED